MSSNASLDILTSSSLQQPCNSMEIKKFKLESNIEIQYNHVCKLTVDIITAAIATTVEVSCVLLIKICTC